MAGDREEQVVVEGWQDRKSVLELLRHWLSHALVVGVVLLEILAESLLQVFGEDLGRQVTQPRLEHAADVVRVVEFLFVEEIDIELGVEPALPVLHLRPTSWHTIESFCFAVEVEIAETC